jgi:hypothetical protein
MNSEKIYDFLQKKGVELTGKLTESLPREVDATGNLRLSIRFDVVPSSNGGFTFNLYLLDYYREVDQGQRPGHRPPIADLENWITAKRLVITPKGKLGRKLPQSKLKEVSKDTTLLRDVAYGIQTKIFRKGTKATRFYSSIIPLWVEQFKKDLAKEFKDFIIAEIRADEHELRL